MVSVRRIPEDKGSLNTGHFHRAWTLYLFCFIFKRAVMFSFYTEFYCLEIQKKKALSEREESKKVAQESIFILLRHLLLKIEFG